MNLKTYYAFPKNKPLYTVAQIFKQRGNLARPESDTQVFYTKKEFERISNILMAQHLVLEGYRFSPVLNMWVNPDGRGENDIMDVSDWL